MINKIKKLESIIAKFLAHSLFFLIKMPENKKSTPIKIIAKQSSK